MKFQKALVTGASSGLGKTLCHLLAQQNIPLILSGRDEPKLKQLQNELPVHTQIITAHLDNRFDQEKLASAIYQQVPDLVINNAGFGLYGPALSWEIHQHHDLVEVNVSALMHLTLAAARALGENRQKGTIMNISSAAAYFSFPCFATYAASKGFVKQFSRALDQELSGEGIRVLTSCPGQIDTPFRNRASKKNIPKEPLTMPVEKAARLIWDQIQKQKQVQIIDRRYQIMVLLTKLFPSSFVMNLLEKRIRKRI